MHDFRAYILPKLPPPQLGLSAIAELLVYLVVDRTGVGTGLFGGHRSGLMKAAVTCAKRRAMLHARYAGALSCCS